MSDDPPPDRAPVRLLAPLAMAACLAASACGGTGPPSDQGTEAVAGAIAAFAAADGEEACDLLTEPALERLYGDRDGCVERSKSFEQGEVRVEDVSISDRGTKATAQARSLGGRDEYTVVARLVAPPGCPQPCPTAEWKIGDVRPR